MYSRLITEMKAKKVSRNDIHELLQIHCNSVSNKLRHRTSFTIDEAMKIQEHFFPECELSELFKTKKGD